MAIDWFRILSDLQRCGVSLRQASQATRVRYGRLYRAWRNPEQDLRHGEGERVLRIWCDRTQRDRTEAPIYRP
jgi:hypothetical protein